VCPGGAMIEKPLFGLSGLKDGVGRDINSSDAVLRLLSKLNRAILQADDLEEMLKSFCTLLAKLRKYLVAWVALKEEDGSGMRIIAFSDTTRSPDVDGRIPGSGPGPACILSVIANQKTVLIPDNKDSEPCRSCPFRRVFPHRCTLAIPLIRYGELLGVFVIHAPEAEMFHSRERDLLKDLADNLAYSIEKIQTDRQKSRINEDLQVLLKITEITLGESDPDKVLPRLARALFSVMDVERCCLAVWDSGRNRTGAFTSVTESGVDEKKACPSEDAVSTVMKQEEPMICDVDGFPVAGNDSGSGRARSVALPLQAHGTLVGVAYLHYKKSEQELSLRSVDVKRAGRIIHHLALALDHVLTVHSNSRRVETLMALHETGLDLGRQLEVRPLLESIVRRAAQLMDSSWGGLYLRVPGGLRLVVAQGFLESYRGQTIRDGEGASGLAAMEKRIVIVDDYRTWSGRAGIFSDVDVGSVIAAPILWRGGLLGVFHVERPEVGMYGPEEKELISLFSEQAAIAIANARLIDGLQSAHEKLEEAYDATLEGWIRALDMRDQETEGHTQRVTDHTVLLAREIGIASEEDLENIRRGALLHDIGKIGIPDAILRKPGPLNPEEWKIMRRHPVLARDMLAHIEYLRPSLTIPYCHHEWFDGSGYPRGLSGDEIPIEARIFSIIDVWDALRSDRPYRRGWPEEKVFEHLRSREGSHFDPGLLERFFSLMGRKLRG